MEVVTSAVKASLDRGKDKDWIAVFFAATGLNLELDRLGFGFMAE